MRDSFGVLTPDIQKNRATRQRYTLTLQLFELVTNDRVAEREFLQHFHKR